MKRIIFISITTIMFYSCIGIQKINTDNLYNKTWKLQSATDFSQKDIHNFDNAFVKFTKSDSVFSGNNGCNMFSGKYLLSGKTIIFGESLSTKRFCRGIDEFKFMKLLNGTRYFHVKNDKLILKENKKTIAVFVIK